MSWLCPTVYSLDGTLLVCENITWVHRGNILQPPETPSELSDLIDRFLEFATGHLQCTLTPPLDDKPAVEIHKAVLDAVFDSTAARMAQLGV